jgi:hypothetical protein
MINQPGSRQPGSRQRGLRLGVRRVGLLAAALVTCFSTSGFAHITPTDLSISITDNRVSVAVGDTVTYVVQVTDADTVNGIAGQTVVTVPSFLTIKSAGQARVLNRQRNTVLSWPLDLLPGASVTFRFSALVGAIPAGATETITQAAVLETSSTVPVVGTADIDSLTRAAAAPGFTLDFAFWRVVTFSAIGLAVMLVAGVIVRLLVMRRRTFAHRLASKVSITRFRH